LKLAISNLPPSTTRWDLKKAFPIATYVYRSHELPNTAYVYFYSPELARKAFDESKDLVIRDSKVMVEFAKQPRAKKETGPMANVVREMAKTKYIKRHGYVQKKILASKKGKDSPLKKKSGRKIDFKEETEQGIQGQEDQER